MAQMTRLCELSTWLLWGALLCAVAASLPVNYDASCPSMLGYGAIPFDDSYASAATNMKALALAFDAAQNAAPGACRTVVVDPQHNFTLVNYGQTLANLTDVTLALEGNLRVWSQNVSAWPLNTNFLAFDNCNNLTITTSFGSQNRDSGFGMIDGLGHPWWWHVILTGHDNRPNLIEIDSSENLLIENIVLVNSPEYHMYLGDVLNVEVRYVVVDVDVHLQKALLRKAGRLMALTDYVASSPLSRDLSQLQIADTVRLLKQAEHEMFDGQPTEIPAFWALNTDGIDVAGSNVWVHDCNITNYDDAVCAKPLNTKSKYGPCTNMLVENIRVKYGVGMTIGSVTPDASVSCIANVTFRNVYFDEPLKGIYIKVCRCTSSMHAAVVALTLNSVGSFAAQSRKSRHRHH